MSGTLSVNGRAYAWPRRPGVVVCLDGCEPAYIEQARAAGLTPCLDAMLARGADLRARCVIPSFTNPNNLSIVTGAPPAVHGICGNFFIDPATGREVMMNDPKYLRCETIPAAFARAGARVAVVTAKDKLRLLLGCGLPLGNGRTACFSAEKAHLATRAENGRDHLLDFVGLPLPEVYSLELSAFVLAAGARLLETGQWDLLYLSTSDYVQHKAAPGSPAANAFYAMMDRALARLLAAGADVALTADHGMKAKHGADGSPCVVYLQPLLDRALGPDAARVILPITDPYVAHHGALGGYAAVHVRKGAAPAPAAAVLRAAAGVEEVLFREEACARFALPPDRTGDLVVLAGPGQTLGSAPERHDLSGLDVPLRSHGGLHEQTVPLLASIPCPPGSAGRDWRNFDAFHLLLNAPRSGD